MRKATLKFRGHFWLPSPRVVKVTHERIQLDERCGVVADISREKPEWRMASDRPDLT